MSPAQFGVLNTVRCRISDILHNLTTFLSHVTHFHSNQKECVFWKPGPNFLSVVSSIFSISRTVFELFAIFVYNGIFLSRGNFTQFLGYRRQNYEFVAQSPQQCTCNGIVPEEKSVLRPVDELKKKDHNKSIRSDKNLPGYFAPLWGPSQLG